MKLHPCKNCGVILDIEQLTFPCPWNEDGTINDDHAAWDGEDYRATVPCPICHNDILNPAEIA